MSKFAPSWWARRTIAGLRARIAADTEQLRRHDTCLAQATEAHKVSLNESRERYRQSIKEADRRINELEHGVSAWTTCTY